MGTEGRNIVEMDVEKVIELLNKAYADEWLAYYQYWVGAQVVEGQMAGRIIGELEEHAEEELEHAEMIAERIIQLGGEPILTPKEWYKETNCGYLTPKDSSVEKILEQNIEGEQCAIKVYHKLAKLTRGKDSVTYHMVIDILEDEVEHEEELQAIQEDINETKKHH